MTAQPRETTPRVHRHSCQEESLKILQEQIARKEKLMALVTDFRKATEVYLSNQTLENKQLMEQAHADLMDFK